MPVWNCWELVGCGRDREGRNVDTLGTCPVPIETRLDGLNHGINGGRVCWALSPEPGPSRFGQQRLGVFRTGCCLDCRFYRLVEREEGACFSFLREACERLREPARPPRWT